MKILMVADSLVTGGRERRMLELIKELTKREEGFDIYLVLLHGIIDYKYAYDLPISLCILERGYRYDFSIVSKLRKIINEYRPDILHSWTSLGSIYLSLANWRLRLPLINGMIADSKKKNIFNKHFFRLKLTIFFSNIVVSNSIAGLKSYRVPFKKAKCIHNGLDFKRFDNLKSGEKIKTELLGNTPKDVFIAAMVGSFEGRKNYPELLDAAQKISYSDKRIFFLLIGGGSSLEKRKKMIPGDLLNKRIFFLGKRTDVESILQIIDVGLLISPSEGISNAILEYMASGKPVIASRNEGTKELVIDGETGFLVDPESPSQIIEKLETLMNDPALRERMGKKGYELVRKKFDSTLVTQSYINLYREFCRVSEKQLAISE
jgi:glycosyltransferase involved in cell wall biosynthesis